MKFLFAAFVLALIGTACASIGLAVWDGRFHRDTAVRPVHYDTNYDLSAQRRMPPEQRN
jgi:hypothetical protein